MVLLYICAKSLLHKQILSKREATQKCNNNTLSAYSEVQLTGRETMNGVMEIIYASLNLVEMVDSKSEILTKSKELSAWGYE